MLKGRKGKEVEILSKESFESEGIDLKKMLTEDGWYVEGNVETEEDLESLWRRLYAVDREPELNQIAGRVGILLITKEGLQNLSKKDIIELVESITGELFETKK